MARFYSDENFPLPVVAVLLRLGHNVFTIFQDGKDRQQYPDFAYQAELIDAAVQPYPSLAGQLIRVSRPG
jgi:hypothetical protein